MRWMDVLSNHNLAPSLAHIYTITLDTREAGVAAASTDANASGSPKVPQGGSKRHAACPAFGTELVPGVVESS
jgi:hypothetical protein